MMKEKEEFERCKRRLQISLKVGKIKFKQFTGKMLSGPDPDTTPTDGEKKITRIGV